MGDGYLLDRVKCDSHVLADLYSKGTNPGLSEKAVRGFFMAMTVINIGYYNAESGLTFLDYQENEKGFSLSIGDGWRIHIRYDEGLFLDCLKKVSIIS